MFSLSTKPDVQGLWCASQGRSCTDSPVTHVCGVYTPILPQMKGFQSTGLYPLSSCLNPPSLNKTFNPTLCTTTQHKYSEDQDKNRTSVWTIYQSQIQQTVTYSSRTLSGTDGNVHKLQFYLILRGPSYSDTILSATQIELIDCLKDRPVSNHPFVSSCYSFTFGNGCLVLCSERLRGAIYCCVLQHATCAPTEFWGGHSIVSIPKIRCNNLCKAWKRPRGCPCLFQGFPLPFFLYFGDGVS